MSSRFKKLIFIGGKGGVGKTTFSQALALALASSGKKTLWATFEDPILKKHSLEKKSENLWHLNIDSVSSFEEYAHQKIKIPGLAHLFIKSNLVQFLAKAAPGIHELVLLGKVWNERIHYDHVVVDLPSTGYGVAMFQSTRNFSALFQGGPIAKDADQMHETFSSNEQCSHVIISLPEEMPLQESIELAKHMEKLFPENPPTFILNRKFPGENTSKWKSPDEWTSPLPASAMDYVEKRIFLEQFNLQLWKDKEYISIEWLPPTSTADIIRGISDLIQEKGLIS